MPLHFFKEKLAEKISQALVLPAEKEKVMELLTVPPQPQMGELSLPLFSFIPKGKSPAQFAQELIEKLIPDEYFQRFQVVGQYLNVFLNKKKFSQLVLESACEAPSLAIKKSSLVMVEYASPNTNKPLHLGHGRNMALGESISRIFEHEGSKVIRVQIVNDRGVHICKSMLAYQRWGKNETPENALIKGDFLVGKYYNKFAEEAMANPKLEEEAQEMLIEWEKSNLEVRKLWEKMNEWALHGINETYSQFGTHFDKEYFESEFYDKAKEVVKEGLERGIFVTAENGAIIAPLKDKNLPDKALLRGDGTTIYITQDIYLALQRFREFPELTKIVYVVASEQDLHFKHLFAILEKMGVTQATQCYHLAYGLVNLPEGKMKSRSGNVVELDDIMQELSALALAELNKRYPELNEKELARRAKVIGLAALKLYLLKIDSRKDLLFIPEESISFEGQTGPYLLYTLARTNSLLKRATQKPSTKESELLSDAKEMELMALLSQKEEIFAQSLRNYSPHTLVQFLLELTNTFNSYYHETKIIQENIPLQKARLALVKALNCVLEEGLYCLGIETLKEM